MKSDKIKNADFKWNEPPDDKLTRFLKKFRERLEDFAIAKEIKVESIQINSRILVEIFYRIDQRFDYYQYFHPNKKNSDQMAQTIEMALYCYWLIKYKPLFLSKSEMEDFWNKNFCTINEIYALHLIETYVTGYYFAVSKKSINYFRPDNSKVMLYNFTHRDLSKEAFILFIGTLISDLAI